MGKSIQDVVGKFEKVKKYLKEKYSDDAPEIYSILEDPNIFYLIFKSENEKLKYLRRKIQDELKSLGFTQEDNLNYFGNFRVQDVLEKFSFTRDTINWLKEIENKNSDEIMNITIQLDSPVKVNNLKSILKVQKINDTNGGIIVNGSPIRWHEDFGIFMKDILINLKEKGEI